MEQLEFNGKKYIKVSSAARETGYTSDYIGQLCRARKIDAKLVGRTWYVAADELRSHRRSRGRSSKEKTREQVREHLSLAQHEQAATFHHRGQRSGFDTTQSSISARLLTKVTYTSDNEALIPIVHKSEHTTPDHHQKYKSDETKVEINRSQSTGAVGEHMVVVEEDAHQHAFSALKTPQAEVKWNGTIVVAPLEERGPTSSIPTSANRAGAEKYLHVETEKSRNATRNLVISTDIDPIDAKNKFLKRMNWAHELNKGTHPLIAPLPTRGPMTRPQRQSVEALTERLLEKQDADTVEHLTVAEKVISIPRTHRVSPYEHVIKSGGFVSALLFVGLALAALMPLCIQTESMYRSGGVAQGGASSYTTGVRVVPFNNLKNITKDTISNIRDMATIKSL